MAFLDLAVPGFVPSFGGSAMLASVRTALGSPTSVRICARGSAEPPLPCFLSHFPIRAVLQSSWELRERKRKEERGGGERGVYGTSVYQFVSPARNMTAGDGLLLDQRGFVPHYNYCNYFFLKVSVGLLTLQSWLVVSQFGVPSSERTKR